MVQRSYKPMSYKHISKAADEIVKYIDERREGTVTSLATRWKKFNDRCMGGIEPNTIYTVAGISGSGKSSFVNSLETDLFELNKSVDFCVLSFNFEMLSSRQVGRKLSSKTNKTTHELYSGSHEAKISDSDLEQVKSEAEKLKKFEIYYVDRAGSVDEIQQTIEYFQNVIAKDRWLLVMLDHTLLTRGKAGEAERTTLANLERMLMTVKKAESCSTTIIQISQMNRGIEDKERISNTALQYPIRSDIFGGDSVFQASDYLLVVHRPETLGIDWYGPNNLPTKDFVYMHVLKNREGTPGVLKFKNNLKYNRIENV